MGGKVALLLDTHVLVWLTLEPGKLPPVATKEIEKALKLEQGLYACAASFWEIALKVRRNKIDLGMSASSFYELCSQVAGLEIVDTTAAVWIASAELDWEHRDPIDRLLVATAEHLDTEMVTGDEAIQKYYKRFIW